METLEQYIFKHELNKEKSISYVQYLNQLLKKYGYDKKPSNMYNKVSISRALWHSIIKEKSPPSLNFTLKVVLAMHCNNHECKNLLKKAGFTLSSSSRYSLIIRYCLEHQIYYLMEVNDYLMKYGYDDQLIY